MRAGRDRRWERRVQSGMVVALRLTLLTPSLAGAQWLGLPDPPDPPEPELAESEQDERSSEARPSRPRPVRARHELTLGALPTFNANLVRRATAPDADYRIQLAVRELSVQAAWAVFGRGAFGVRWSVGVGVGRSALLLTEPLSGFATWRPGPFRLRGPTLSVDAAVGMLARIGLVRFGPQLSFTETRLGRASGQTIDEDVPYTTPARLRRAGVGFLVHVLPHANVGLVMETRLLVAPQRVGGQLRIGVFGAWSGGTTGAHR